MKNITYTTNQAEGAIPNGTVVEKIRSDETDTHKDGALAIVVGSIGPYHMIQGKIPGPLYGYWVLWADMNPTCPVFIAGHRIRIKDMK